MKEQLYKYLSIGLLALLLLVCFGSLITYFVVGQESINNVANAMESDTGYADTNYVDLPDCLSWTFNFSGEHSNFYVGTNFSYSLVGSGISLVNNVLSCSSGVGYLVLSFNNSLFYNYWYCSVGYVSNNGVSGWLIADSQRSFNTNSNYNYFYIGRSFTPTSNSSINLYVEEGESITLRFISFTSSNTFGGFVPNSYSPNGYNKGYTDGVNSVSGGTDEIPLDLTNVTWRSPSVATVSNVDGLYDVTGSFDSSYIGSNFTFDKIQLVSGNTIFGEDGEYSPMYLIDSSIVGASGIIPVMASELLTFTGGDDVANTELIEWLQVNNGFLSYTDGYQDGYNDGEEIGYQNGFSDGQEKAQLSLSGIYNLVGSIKTLGNINSFTFNGSTYVAYSGETDSFTDSSSVTYYANYYDTQGDDGVLLGYCVDYLFRYSVKVRTIVYGTSARWNQVGFNIIAINTNDNTYFTLSRDDTSYYKEYGSLGADNSNGTYISCEFDFEFPSPDEYRLIFVPISHNVSDDKDNATMLVFEDTYFLSQGSGSMSYDDYNYLISDAYNRGMNTGRTNGYDDGRQVGYNVGYTKGVEDAGEYTFNGLLGAVFDAPITMFIGKYNSETGLREGGLLNFNLLGINLGGFVIALLSLGLILFILRLFVRGL